MWLCTVTFVSSSLFLRRIELSPKTFGHREREDSVVGLGRLFEVLAAAGSA